MDSLRVLLIISELGSGGGQRDLCRLAVHLHRRGYEVEVLVFRKVAFFNDVLAEAGVPVTFVPSRNWPHLFLIMRRAVRQRDPDAVVAFLDGANLLVEFAGLPRRKFAIVVTELNGRTNRNLVRRLCLASHRISDAVVCNTHEQRDRIVEVAPYLRQRTSVIVNGVDLEHFKPAEVTAADRHGQLRLLVVARLHWEKNPFGLVEALDILRREHPALDLAVDWYGEIVASDEADDIERWPRGRRKAAEYYIRVKKAVAARSLDGRFRLRGARKDVVALSLYREADAVCLPSLSEGTPNVICEALACGAPVLAARVGGISRLIEDGKNGILFDPATPGNIAEAILRFSALSPEARLAMGRAGRKTAEALLPAELFADRYAALIDRFVSARRGRADGGRARLT